MDLSVQPSKSEVEWRYFSNVLIERQLQSDAAFVVICEVLIVTKSQVPFSDKLIP